MPTRTVVIIGGGIAGLAAAVMAVDRGASIVRTHDVPATVDALKIAQAVMQSEQS